MHLRDRVDEDLPALVQLARVVHGSDGYPLYLPADLGRFLVSPDAHRAWVAEDDGTLLGHVALHSRSWEGVMALARQETGLGDEQLAVVARLLVSPSDRRRGTGRALLRVAARTAWDLGYTPILDVATAYQAAHRLYEAEGWRRLGTVGFPIPDGHTVDEHVYLGPRSEPAG